MKPISRRNALKLSGAAFVATAMGGRAMATPVRRVICWGDSLTAGGAANNYPSRLQQRRGGVVLNRGVGGQKSTQIAMRAGALPVRLTVANNRILAGSAEVVAINGQVLVGHAIARDPDDRFLSTPSRGDAISVRGALAGVRGRLTGRGVEDGKPAAKIRYTFAADQAVAQVACPPDSVFQVETEMSARDVAVLWVGRNNYADGARVLADIAAMVAALPMRRFLILSILNGDYPVEAKGEAKWRAIMALNQRLAARYGRRYLDIRAILVGQGAGGSHFAQIEDHGRDLPPRTLRADKIHLNPAGQQIVADAVAGKLAELRW